MECNSFSKLYLYLIRKSVAYIFCREIQDKIDKFFANFDKLKKCVKSEYLWCRPSFVDVAHLLENWEEINEAIEEFIDISESARVQRVKPVFMKHVKSMERFIKEYEERIKELENILENIGYNMGELRKYGVPPTKCSEIAIYISSNGLICTPRVGNDTTRNFFTKNNNNERYYRIYYHNFIHTYIASRMIKRGWVVDLWFKYMNTNKSVCPENEKKIVAVPVERYADVIDSYVVKKVLRKTFSGG